MAVFMADNFKLPMAQINLSNREKEMLQNLSNGLGYKEMAQASGLSIDTVRKHLQSAYRKLGVHSGAEAVGKAMRLGLIF